MQKYAKLLTEEGVVSVGLNDDDSARYEDYGYSLMEVAQSSEGVWYLADRVPSPSDEYLFSKLRAIRNSSLQETDKYMIVDFPITDTLRSKILEYRQCLRDITEQPGAPWDGGGELTPWPKLPSVG